MSFLFDENLSPTLPGRLAGLFPGSFHVQHFNYSGMPDLEVWRLAQEQGLCIVSCDSDFNALSFANDPPPKVVWLQMKASETAAVEKCLRENEQLLAGFLADEEQALLILRA